MENVFTIIAGAVDPEIWVVLVVSFAAVAWWGFHGRRDGDGDGGNDAPDGRLFGDDDDGDGDGDD